jgi:hypothetical protein
MAEQLGHLLLLALGKMARHFVNVYVLPAGHHST